MSRAVPAATSALRVLRFLAQRTTPVPAALIATEIGLPRSSTYHLLTAMAAESFVTHYPDDRTWGVGVAAWEVGQGYTRADPLARLARLPIARLVDGLGLSAHLAVLHGADVVYVIEERAKGRARLVTDVGVRLPAHLTASGRAILSTLSPAQMRAAFPPGANSSGAPTWDRRRCRSCVRSWRPLVATVTPTRIPRSPPVRLDRHRDRIAGQPCGGGRHLADPAGSRSRHRGDHLQATAEVIAERLR